MTTIDKYPTEKRSISSNVTNNKGILDEWLEENFRVEGTRKIYRAVLLVFLKAMYGENEYDTIHKVDVGIVHYLNEQRNFLADFKRLIRYMTSKQYAPTFIHTVASYSKTFFSAHGHAITDKDWRAMKRTLLPSNVVATQDEILTKEQLRKILNHLSIHGRALMLFLVSTGARIGETMQLKLEDLDLDANPPRLNIRPSYTKKGVGGRITWMSYEARDTLKEWLNIKDSRLKATGKPFPKQMVFGFSAQLFRTMWWSALKKTGLDQRDPSTTKKVRIYHIHTLRKFFRTQMGLAKVPDMVVHAWMGHKAYLNTYDKLGKKKMAEIYRDHMAAVSVYVSDEQALQSQAIISESELDSYLTAGWMFKATLPSGKIVVEGKPGQLRPGQIKRKREKKSKPIQPQQAPSYEEPKTDAVTPI